MVGPGVERGGIDSRTWADHTDVRPTMMDLLGLTDDYRHDGRVLFEIEGNGSGGSNVHGPDGHEHGGTLQRLAEVYKQINAPFGQLGLDILPISTAALTSNASGDARYTDLETKLEGFSTRRDTIAGQMIAMLDGVEFKNQHLDEQ
jgi:hypothetical protein